MLFNKKKKNCGQVLVLFLGFSAAVLGMMLIAFNSGQVSNAKMRAMNAADAAAYSGAVWQARTLNFQAYMNRAMVVNEVTIAQSVSLRSWVSYVDNLVANVDKFTKYIPYIGNAINAVSKVIGGIDTGVQNGLPPVELALRAMNVIEHTNQNISNAAGAAVAQDLATEVAQLNGATMTAGNAALYAANVLKWNTFTSTYGKTTGKVGTDGRTRMREVDLNSRDGFTQARDRVLTGPLWLYQFRKQGGTDLLGFSAWKGLDSMEFRTAYNPFKGKWSIEQKIGWGGAQAFSPGKVSTVGTHGNINEWNHADGQAANDEANNKHVSNLRAEFQGYRDIAKPLVRNADLRLPFAVEVEITGAHIATASSAMATKTSLTDGTTIEQDPHYVSASGGVSALAEACVSYARPYNGARADGLTEFPSLFNPYWRASMATESKTARMIVDSAKGLAPIATFLEGTGSCN